MLVYNISETVSLIRIPRRETPSGRIRNLISRNIISGWRKISSGSDKKMANKWQKKLKKFFSAEKSQFSGCAASELSVLALLILRVCLQKKTTLAAALPDSASADGLTEEIRVWKEKLDIDLDYLAIPECGRGKLLFPGGESRRARALDDLLNKKYDLVIGSINSLLGPAQAPAEIREAALILKPDMEIPPSILLEKLVALDYDDEYEVTVSGEFAKRGGIIDLYSPAHDAPCRVEFFGDTVETLRLFKDGKVISLHVFFKHNRYLFFFRNLTF